MRLEVIQAPATEPVTLAEAKTHLRVPGTSDDAWITDAITAAREHVEDLTRRRLITQKWRLYLDRFPGEGVAPATLSGSMLINTPRRWDIVLIDVAPVASVDALKYYDFAGVLQTVDPSIYQLVAEAPARVALAYAQVWPGSRAWRDDVRVEVTSGYGAAAAVPKRCKQAMYLMLGHWYEHREQVGDSETFPLPDGVENMLSPLMSPAY